MEGRSFCEFSNMFCPNGAIPIAFFNVPGSVHDGQIADCGNVYVKMEQVHINNGGICDVDSIFDKVRSPYLIKSCQDPCS